MKNYILLPLSCALLIASGCSQMALKSAPTAAKATITLPPPPTPPIQEDAPSAYYQANTQKFGQPVNPTYQEQYTAYKAQVKLIEQQNYNAKLDAYHKLVQAVQQKTTQLTALTMQQALTVTEQALPEAPKVLIPKTKPSSAKNAAPVEEIDVASIDRELAYLESKARHYAPVFNNKVERKVADVRAKTLAKTLNEYAADPNASYEVLLRAMKANVIARNMDVGTNSTEKSIECFNRLLKLKPKDPETSFWYGFSLAEGGGFKEAIPHLNVAIKAGYQEAHLALANTYMLMEQKKNAINTLNTYKTKFPDDAEYANLLIEQIKGGNRYSVWQFIPQPEATPTTPVTSQALNTATPTTPITATPKNSLN